MARKRYNRMSQVFRGTSQLVSGAVVDMGADGDLKVSAVSATGAFPRVIKATISAGGTSAAGKKDSAAFSDTIPAGSIVLNCFLRNKTEWLNKSGSSSAATVCVGWSSVSQVFLVKEAVHSGLGTGYYDGAVLTAVAAGFSAGPYIASATITPVLYLSADSNTSAYSAGCTEAFITFIPRAFGDDVY